MTTCTDFYNIIHKVDSCDYYSKYNELITFYPNDKNKIDFIFYDLFNYEPKKLTEKEQRKDTKFRNQVRAKYNNVCMITGKPIDICDVAHIYPFSQSSEIEKYDVDNGFLLSKELHVYFDLPTYDFKIDPDTSTIILSDDILTNSSLSEYHKYHNTKIKLNKQNKEYLRKKYSLNLFNITIQS